jgi:hypothetical protein
MDRSSRGEEALSDSIVERVTDGAHRGDQRGVGQAPAEPKAGVLAAVDAEISSKSVEEPLA